MPVYDNRSYLDTETPIPAKVMFLAKMVFVVVNCILWFVVLVSVSWTAIAGWIISLLIVFFCMDDLQIIEERDRAYRVRKLPQTQDLDDELDRQIARLLE
jgi:fatty acid desaturase